MRPEHWATMSDLDRKEYAIKFFNTQRGSFIIGQALHIAIEKLREVEHPEVSNIEDMTVLQEIFFPYHILMEGVKKHG